MPCSLLGAVLIGSSSNARPLSGVAVLTANALGRPCEGGGRVTLVNRAGDRVDVVVSAFIGRIRMEWVFSDVLARVNS